MKRQRQQQLARPPFRPSFASARTTGLHRFYSCPRREKKSVAGTGGAAEEGLPLPFFFCRGCRHRQGFLPRYKCSQQLFLQVMLRH